MAWLILICCLEPPLFLWLGSRGGVIQRERLRTVIRNLLLSADASWESGDHGHDWPLACLHARQVLDETAEVR